LWQELVTVTKDKDQEHVFCAQYESTIEFVSKNFAQFWSTFRQVALKFPKDISLIAPVELVEIIVYS